MKADPRRTRDFRGSADTSVHRPEPADLREHRRTETGASRQPEDVPDDVEATAMILKIEDDACLRLARTAVSHGDNRAHEAWNR